MFLYGAIVIDDTYRIMLVFSAIKLVGRPTWFGVRKDAAQEEMGALRESLRPLLVQAPVSQIGGGVPPENACEVGRPAGDYSGFGRPV